ncbi:MAG: NACHT domain-containing protein, partial [bacterium]|nr:NACHT domain-containing protein [bacterium]
MIFINSKINSDYIIPRLKLFLSYKVAQLKSGEDGSFLLEKAEEKVIIDYFIYPRTFVIAEPGYGKTRLLQELSITCRSLGKKSLFVDLKKSINQQSLIDYLRTCIDELEGSKQFKIVNSEDIILCLDGLDEVKQDNFTETITKIKTFSKLYPKVLIALSCRWHFFEKYQELFVDTDFKYLRIYPFSVENIRKYLKQASLLDGDIDKLINSLQFRHRNLIIQTPRYLEFLFTYIKEKGIKDIGNITRTDLFEHFIYQKLDLEDKRLSKQKKDLVKRVLEKLALIMEIYQTNILTKDELMTFFDDLNSDLKVSLLNQVPLEVFFDNSLLKDNGKTIEFDNTEFQEYLAAKEITRLGHIEQTVFDLSIDQELKEIFPSWFNTLTFLLELDISLLKPILDFGSR